MFIILLKYENKNNQKNKMVTFFTFNYYKYYNVIVDLFIMIFNNN